MKRGLGQRLTFHVTSTVLLLSVTLAVSKVTANRKPEPLLRPLSTIGLQIAGFTGTENPPLLETVLQELKATSYITRTYRRPDLDADLFIAFYARQRAGESMHSPKHCLPGSGWEIWDYSTIEIPAGPNKFTINKYSISHDSDRRVVLYWYQSRKRVFASEYLGKLLLSQDALLQNSTAAAIVRIIVRDKPGATQGAAEFAAELIPQMQRLYQP
jgi:EpsI family protein